MNRAIKFRAFDLDDKEMIEVSALDWSDGKIISLNYPNGKKYPDDKMGDRVRIMQFTGLKDKNGVEIYEGDIIKHYLGNFEVTYNEYHGYRVALRTISIESPSDMVRADAIHGEIIGNIYTTPNLLK